VKLLEGVARVPDLDAFLAVLDDVAASRDVTVQAFDARYVVSRAHLELAVELADRAVARGENVARERAVEILLYAAGRRQIDRALAMGVDEGECPVVVLVDAGPARSGDDGDSGDKSEARAVDDLRDRLDLTPGRTLGDYDPECVRAFFDVGDAELGAVAGTLEDVVLERVALLDVEK
jgi:KEOPS complex subunit Cgi121